jgi:hypothetical protein
MRTRGQSTGRAEMNRTASAAAPSRPRRWPIVAALGLSQIIGYGTLYYAFSVLAPAMARDLDWSTEWVFGALSLSLLAGGLAALVLTSALGVGALASFL